MTTEPRGKPIRPLVQPFPKPGPALVLAYRELNIAIYGTDDQRKSLGNIADLPRPWIPSTCTRPQLRTAMWNWLEQVVTWLNHEYVFDPVDVIPACWPRHADLVNEISALADQRWRAQTALTSEFLEDWHRFALPTFLERMRHRCAEHCVDAHPPTWPAAGRLNRHLDDQHAADRRRAYADDVNATRAEQWADETATESPPRLRLVDEQTGEVLD